MNEYDGDFVPGQEWFSCCAHCEHDAGYAEGHEVPCLGGCHDGDAE